MRPAKAMATARSGPAKLVLTNPGNKVRQGTFCADHACYKCLGIGLICFGFVLLAFFAILIWIVFHVHHAKGK